VQLSRLKTNINGPAALSFAFDAEYDFLSKMRSFAAQAFGIFSYQLRFNDLLDGTLFERPLALCLLAAGSPVVRSAVFCTSPACAMVTNT